MSILDSIYSALSGAANYVSSAVQNLGSSASSAVSNVETAAARTAAPYVSAAVNTVSPYVSAASNIGSNALAQINRPMPTIQQPTYVPPQMTSVATGNTTAHITLPSVALPSYSSVSTPSAASKALQQTSLSNSNLPTPFVSRTTTPVVTSAVNNLSPSPAAAKPADQTVTAYVPYGSRAQTELLNTKLVYEPNGQVDFYQQSRPGSSLYNLVSSGSRNALQSGMFTINAPETGLVYTQGGAGTTLASTANASEATKIMTNPNSYSRLGSEVYGGYVTPLTGATVQSTGAKLSTYSNVNNLANLVSPYAPNMGKAALPDISAPWSVPSSAPAIQELSSEGMRTVNVPYVTTSTLPSNSVKTIMPTRVSAAEPITVNMSGDYAGLPSPFISGGGLRTTVPASGDIFGFKIPVVSNVLSFFQPGTLTTTKTGSPVTLPETTIMGEPVVKTVDGVTTTTTPYTTTGGTATPVTTTTSPIPSGWDELQKSVRTTLNLPSTEVGERAVKYASLVNPSTWPLTLPSIISEISPASKETKQVASVINPYSGQYTQFYEQPLLVPASYAMGAIGGTLFKGADTAFGAGKSIAVPLLESSGKAGTAAKIVSTVTTPLIEQVPKVLGGLYAADIGYRSTSGLTDFTPEKVSSTAKGLVLQEAVPMGAGFALPGQISSGVKGIKTGFEEYKSVIAERGSSTPRISLTPTEGEVALTTYATKVPTFGEYAKYSVQKSVPESILNFPEYVTSTSPRYGLKSDIGNLPTKVGRYIESTPQYLYAGAKEINKLPSIGLQSIVEPIVSARITAVPKMQAALGKASIDIAALRYGERAPLSESLYNKYFTAKLNLPISAEKALVSGETKLWELGQLAKTPGVTTKSLWQEYKPSIQWEGEPRYVYSLKFGKPTTIPSIGDTTGYSAGVIKKGVTPASPSFGGFERITGTKIIGGKATTSLSVEKPTRGITKSERASSWRTEPTGFAKSKVQYFGERTSNMKPMGKVEGKQAAGQLQIMSETLPTVEGMPTGKMSPGASYPLFVPQVQQGRKEVTTEMGIPKIGSGVISSSPSQEDQQLISPRGQKYIRTVEPSLEFMPTSERRTGVASLASLSSDQTLKSVQGLVSGSKSLLTSEVVQKQKESSSMSDISRLVSTTIRPSYKEDIRQTPSEDQLIKTIPIVDIVPTTKPITIIEPKVTTTTELKKTITEVPKIPPLFGGSLSGGGGGGEGPRKRYKRHEQIWEYNFDPYAAARVTAKALKVGSNVTRGPGSSLPTFGLRPTRSPTRVQQSPTKATPRAVVPKQKAMPVPSFKMPSMGIMQKGPTTKSGSNTELKSISLSSSLPTQKKKKGKK